MPASDLADFLLARIEEDEATATAAAVHLLDSGSGGFGDIPPEVWAHVRGWRTARVLKECDAKRQVVEYCSKQIPVDDRNADGTHGITVLLMLALPYAEHSDYREEWKL